MPVLIDFESRSRADLSIVGGRAYWADPSTEALCVVWYDTRDELTGVWYPGQPWPHVGRMLAAHNAMGFDRFGAERYAFGAVAWVDTSALARKAGLPGALDALGTRWLGAPKDSEGSRFTRSLSSVRRPREIGAAAWKELSDDEKRACGALPELDAAGYARVTAYCASDVAILAAAWPRLEPWCAVDADAEHVDRIVNDRGICFDATLARALLAHDARNGARVIASVARELGETPAAVAAAARSPAQFCAATGAADARADTVTALDHPLARARKALASIARGKLEAGLARVSPDGRLRDALRYYGAHTGRWSGQGMQLHNLPRPAKRLEDADVDALAAEVLAGRACDADEIALLVRATLTASPGRLLVVRDYSAVEARATAWAAVDRAALEVFASGRDPYLVAASRIFERPIAGKGFERTIGKIAELALGYGGGVAAFEKFARAQQIDISALDVRAIVDAWRELHAPIRSLWYAAECAFRAACDGRSKSAGPFRYDPGEGDDEGSIACELPSGRVIVYPEARAGAESLSYAATKCREHVYGGKLVENAIQAFCRDLLADALVRADSAGLNPVLHVHDEIVCDVPRREAKRAAQALEQIMLSPPVWASDFPVACAGWEGVRYRK